MLSEKKEKFHLVMANVKMPDMDGIKFFETVGLQMDIPVIMVSANDGARNMDKEMRHEAYDFPIKFDNHEELQIIIDYVIRLNKFYSEDDDSKECMSNEGAQGPLTRQLLYLNKKRPSKKRTEHKEEDEEQNTERSHENDDRSTIKKKQRLKWTNELVMKFDAAINQLGLDNALPKEIHQIMNVESITVRHVSSKLQSYRKRVQEYATSENQQDNMG